MADWLDALDRWLNPPRRRILHRPFVMAEPARAWIESPLRTPEELMAFADLLLRLDANPVLISAPILKPGAPPGMRWVTLAQVRVIFVFDPSKASIHIVTIS